MGLAIRGAKKLALKMGLSQYKANKAAEDAASEEEGKCLEEEAAGEGEKSDDGTSEVKLESNLDADTAEETEDGSF